MTHDERQILRDHPAFIVYRSCLRLLRIILAYIAGLTIVFVCGFVAFVDQLPHPMGFGEPLPSWTVIAERTDSLNHAMDSLSRHLDSMEVRIIRGKVREGEVDIETGRPEE